MPVATVTTSAAGSLNLLHDEDLEVRSYALQHLLNIVPQFWAEISDQLPYLEDLCESSSELPSDARPLASLLISKTYFYIGIQEEAVEFALKAGSAFEKEPASEYKETITAGCLDRAIRETQQGKKLERGLEGIVDAVMRSGAGENGKLSMGLALSLRRLDLVEMIFVSSRGPSHPSSPKPIHDESLLRYVLSEVVSGTSGNEAWGEEFLHNLFGLLLRLFASNPTPDYASMTILWIQDNDYTSCGEALVRLLESKQTLEAYQIAFDLNEMAGQAFSEGVIQVLEGAGKGVENEDAEEDDETPEAILHAILRGTKSAELFLNFLNKNNKADLATVKSVKESFEVRYSIYHSAVTFTNAFASCGTASMQFLRDNRDYLVKASNWARFSTTAALGLIHRGNWATGYRVVQPYLPGGQTPNKYGEGGALFALGLIFAGRLKGEAGDKMREYLADGVDEVVSHGAALGLGMAGLATADEEVYDQIRNLLFQDNATSGEAAGYAMGLVMLGTASDKAIDEMWSYAKETQHEKIIRSLAVGMALVMYGTREKSDVMVEKMMDEKDAIIRYGAMFTIGLAWAGTGSNKAVRKLLHVAVSDVNDDVRRGAVTALGFVLFRNHTQVPRVVQLLAESYNPHVRHGATLALGISCAGTGLEAAIDLLEPMTKDPVDFVRQGAYIALSMILIQVSEAQVPKVTAIREMFNKVVSDKPEDPIARFGAALAQGIIDAGGRNMTLSLSSRAGTLNMRAVVGMTLFVQFWYWFPLAHGLGLAFSPTAIIALDEKLRIPELEFECHARPSLFAYPQEGKKVEEKKKEKSKAAVLSTTAKAKARERTKREEKGEGMDLDEDSKEKDGPDGADGGEDGQKSASAKKPAAKAEPSSFTLPNLSRVTPTQIPFIAFSGAASSERRYEPIRPIGDPAVSSASASAAASGSTPAATQRKVGPPNSAQSPSHSQSQSQSGSIILLRDKKPTEEGKYVELDGGLWPSAKDLKRQREEAEQARAAAAAGSAAGGAGAGAGASGGPGTRGAGAAAGAARGGEMEGGEADMPPPFEYPFPQ